MPSLEQSSTRMSSIGFTGADSTAAMACRMVAFSLKAGMTTESRGAAEDPLDVISGQASTRPRHAACGRFLEVAATHWRKLDSCQLLQPVLDGVKFKGGGKIEKVNTTNNNQQSGCREGRR